MQKRRKRLMLSTLTSAADAIASDLLVGGATSDRVRTLVRQVAEETGFPFESAARGIYSLAARDPRLLSTEPTAALEAQLEALLLFAPVTHASLWLVDGSGEVCAAKAGNGVSLRQVRGIARRALDGERARNRRDGSFRVVPVMRWDIRWGALVVDPRPRSIRRALDYAGETAHALSPLVERQLLLGQALESGGRLLDAAERRVARMAFDIHDGPLQSLSLVIGELSALERQLHAVADKRALHSIERRMSGLRKMVSELDCDLRELATAAGGGAALPLREMVERAVSNFSRRARVRPKLVVEGEVDQTTASQRIAVARVVEEALANAREHSGASRVEISVRRDAGSLNVRIIDNGRGFDVGRALRRAARDGRLGLVAMDQRIRLLGGRLQVDSRPGGPTAISAFLPAWEPPKRASKGRR